MYLELKPNKYGGGVTGGGVTGGVKSEQVDVEMMRRVSSSSSSSSGSRKGVDELDDVDERNMLLDAGGGSSDDNKDGSLTSISTASTSTAEEFAKWWKFVKQLLAQRPFKSYVGECLLWFLFLFFFFLLLDTTVSVFFDTTFDF